MKNKTACRDNDGLLCFWGFEFFKVTLSQMWDLGYFFSSD